jgi:hypothetical protein
MMRNVKPRAVAKILTVDVGRAKATGCAPPSTSCPQPPSLVQSATASGFSSSSLPAAEDSQVAPPPAIHEDSSTGAFMELRLQRQVLMSNTDLHGERVEGLRYREVPRELKRWRCALLQPAA